MYPDVFRHINFQSLAFRLRRAPSGKHLVPDAEIVRAREVSKQQLLQTQRVNKGGGSTTQTMMKQTTPRLGRPVVGADEADEDGARTVGRTMAERGQLPPGSDW